MIEKEISKDLFHSYSVKEVFDLLSSGEGGISEEEAVERLSRFGPNEIKDTETPHPFFIFIKQFKSLLILVLFIAAAISAFYGKFIDVYVILGVVLLNAAMGFIQEYKAEKAMQALKNIIVPTAKVYREGDLKEIEARKLVPGDVVVLEEGDRIPADIRLFQTRSFRTVEASLTGESGPIDKNIDEIDEKTPMADRKNMSWMGTFTAGGSAKGIVVFTGLKTAFGRIAEDIEKIGRVKSHFEKKIDKLAKQMGLIAIAGAAIIFITGFFFKGIEFGEIMGFTIASLVSGIPEGLPAILVIVLAVGAGRMAKRNAIIRRLSATETLGVTTVISTDKTGTLTQNTMNVRKIALADEDEVEVFGNGWEPFGDFHRSDKKISPLEDEVLAKLLHIAAVCNNAKLIKEESEKKEYKIIGDPTEASLVVLAEKAGLKKDILGERRTDDMPFNAELKYRASLSAITRDEKGKEELYVIGAPEAVLSRSACYLGKAGRKKEIDKEKKKEIMEKIDEMTQKAMRTIALAYKPLQQRHISLSDEMVNDLVFVGVVGIIDPPRPEARNAVLSARNAGIRVIMTTGDHKGTALAIAREVAIIRESSKDNQTALTETDLLEMSEEEFKKAAREVNVFARLTPNMKLKIAESLQLDGDIVAMTGDGVNDAPAIKKADIGISMGIMGTDVARESSEIILADDNFASIVNAIEEGRIVFTNTRQASTFLITTNFAEFATLVTSLFLFIQLPLLPTQILWLNLVTDGVAGFPLAMEPGHGDVLSEPPRKKKEGILSKEIIPFLILMMVVMAILTVFFFWYHLATDGNVEKARTAAFSTMAFTQLFNALNMRSMRRSVFGIGFFSNKHMVVFLLIGIALQIAAVYLMGPIFHFEPLTALEVILIFVLSSFVLWFGELYKRIRYGKNPRMIEK